MTRRAHGEGHVRKRADGRWEVQVTGADGKVSSLYARTRGELTTKLQEAASARSQGIIPAPSRLTLARYLESWLRVKQSSRRAATYASYEAYCRQHIVPALGSIPLSRVTAQDVEAFLAGARSKKGEKLSPRTIAHLRSILRNALGAAVRQKLIALNAAALSEAPKLGAKEMVVLSTAEAPKLTAVLQDHDDGAIYMLGMMALRLGEVLGLRWRDVDFARGRLTVHQTYQLVKRERVFGEPKSSESRRTVNLAPHILEALQRVRDRQTFDRARAESIDAWEAHGGGDLCFTDELGRPRNPSTVTRNLHHILTSAGVTDVTFHGLRHSAATLLMAAGENPKVVSELLGHTSIALTLSTYSHASEGMKKAATDRLAAIYTAPVAGPG